MEDIYVGYHLEVRRGFPAYFPSRGQSCSARQLLYPSSVDNESQKKAAEAAKAAALREANDPQGRESARGVYCDRLRRPTGAKMTSSKNLSHEEERAGLDRFPEHALDAMQRIGVGEHEWDVTEEQGWIDAFVGTAGPRQGEIPGGRWAVGNLCQMAIPVTALHRMPV